MKGRGPAKKEKTPDTDDNAYEIIHFFFFFFYIGSYRNKGTRVTFFKT